MDKLSYALALTTLSTSTVKSFAQQYELDMIGTITEFQSDSSVANQFPFAGLHTGDQLHYHFEYDISAPPTGGIGDISSYTVDGHGSYMTLGSSTVSFEELWISVGTSRTGFGIVLFSGYNYTLNLYAAFMIVQEGSFSDELPTSIDLKSFNYARDSWASSWDHDLQGPIVMGSVDSISITPAPASALTLMCAGVLVGRRRRS